MSDGSAAPTADMRRLGDAAYPGTWPFRSERVEWAADAARAALEDVGVDHRRRYVAVTEELLHRPDVMTAFQQVRRE